MDAKDGRTITRWVVWGTIVLWIAWDVIAVVEWGGYATESAEIGSAAERFATLPLAFGVLGGHWFWKVPAGTPPWKHRHLVLVGLAIMATSADTYFYVVLEVAYPLEYIAAMPVVGYPIGHFVWPQCRVNG